MHPLFRNFDRIHLIIFLGFYAVFAGLTFLALNAGSSSDRSDNAIAAATIGAVTGPFTGAIARNFQSCCWEFSLSLFPYCALFLGGEALLQILPLPFQRFEHSARITFWCLGLIGWFGGVPVSFGHALS